MNYFQKGLLSFTTQSNVQHAITQYRGKYKYTIARTALVKGRRADNAFLQVVDIRELGEGLLENK